MIYVFLCFLWKEGFGPCSLSVFCGCLFTVSFTVCDVLLISGVVRISQSFRRFYFVVSCSFYGRGFGVGFLYVLVGVLP